MSDVISSSLVRLIVFHSGKYEFAEVQMDAPLHLMGANNVGKTSLIAMLQFLYLDNQKSMHFSHPLPDTRRYYFPHTNSYILFECRTPEGMAVVGVHGLGAARQYEFERFFYRGRFNPSDFMAEDRRMLETDEVKARLVGKGFVKLEGRHLRAALSGVGDDKGVRLGLVPLRDRSQYDRFRFLFCNLLRLAQLRQDELKSLLVEIYHNEFQQLKIDLAVGYRERFLRLQRDAQSVRDLRWIEKDVLKLFELVQKRDTARGSLPVLWIELGRVFTKRENELKQIAEDKHVQREAFEVREQELKLKQQDLSNQRDKMLARQGGLRSQLNEFHQLETSMMDFIPEWAEQRKHEVEKQMGEIRGHLSLLEGDHPKRIAARLQRLEDERKRALLMRDSAKHLLLARLREEFKDGEIAEIFRVLNPALLQLQDNEVELNNLANLHKRLDRLLKNLSGNQYNDGDVSLVLKQVAPEDIAARVNPEQLAQRVEELSHQIKRETALFEAARDRAGQEQRLEQLRQKAQELSQKLFYWQDFCKKRVHSEEWESELQKLEAEANALQRKIEEHSNEIQSLEKKRQKVADAIRIAEQEYEGLLEKQRRLSPPTEKWEAEEDVLVPDNLDDLYERYRRTFENERRFSEEVFEKLRIIQERTYEKYNASSEAETLKRLGEAIDALGSREVALRKSWADLAVGLRSSFAALSHDLERLQGKVADLNRRMGKVAISNLDAVRLIVSERPEWMKRIRMLCDLQDDLPLFDGVDTDSKEMEELGRLLEQAQTVGLHDLFDLHFEIQRADGKERRYTNLDKIESNGTTITIKVLVHLILLRDLMSGGKARVPFYLDEVSSLDHENIAGIIRQATALDFVPILASPDSVEEVDRIYLLAENEQGRIVLDKTALIELRREHEST